MIPKYIKADFMSAFRNTESMRWPGFYPVSDKANNWLTNNLGITTDCNETELGPFIARFNWHTQTWFVST